MIRTTDIRTCIQKSILILLLLAAPIPASALHYLPEGCFGQINEDQVVVYYFTRKFRCQSCETLENTMLETVRINYSSSFSTGKLAMCVINVDDPVNRHFMDEFEILSTSVYIVEKRGDEVMRSQKLDEVWDILDDAQAISRLLMKGLAKYLGETGRDSNSASNMSSGSDGKSADAGDNSGSSGQTSKPAHRVRDPEGKAAGPGK